MYKIVYARDIKVGDIVIYNTHKVRIVSAKFGPEYRDINKEWGGSGIYIRGVLADNQSKKWSAMGFWTFADAPHIQLVGD